MASMSSAMSKALRTATAVVGLLVFLSAATATLNAGKKKKDTAPPKTHNMLESLDYSKIVWPNPPAITRIRYLNYFCCDKYTPEPDKKKSSWMDRMAARRRALCSRIQSAPASVAIANKQIR